MINNDIPSRDEFWSGKCLYKCDECDASYKSKGALHNHTSSKHNGICYSCKYCEYKATRNGSLKMHQKSIHEEVKYSCNQCDYRATTQCHLKTHKLSVHEGVMYSCNKCGLTEKWIRGTVCITVQLAARLAEWRFEPMTLEVWNLYSTT